VVKISKFFIIIITIAPAFGQDGGVPGALLNYGMTPRSIAIGKAFTGLADDQEAVYYNPAGLTQLLEHNIKSSYLSLYGAQLGYLGYALPTRRFGTFGVGVIYYAADDIDSRDEMNNPYGSYRFTQNCVIISYAYQPVIPLGIGTNLKVITSKVAQYGAIGMGGDLGIFLFPRRNFRIGLTCQNILGPKLTHYQRTEDFPLTFRFGGSLKLYQGRATIVLDVVKNILSYTRVEPHVGVEFIPLSSNFILRGGIDRNFLNAGMGLRNEWRRFSAGLDYSIELHYASSYLLPYRHKIGLYINFGGFRTWVEATPKQFSPTPGRKENVAWLDLHYTTKRKIKRWQLLIKNGYGEIVRTYSGWDDPPLRLSWDGLDDVGRVVADGKYFYELLLIDERGETLKHADFLVRVATLGPAGEIEFVPQE